MESMAEHDADAVVEGSSAYGFRNVVPRSREMRKILTDREHVERKRLESRRDGFRVSNEEAFVNPLLPAENSVAFIAEGDRFYRDVAEEERRVRVEAAERKARVIQERREDATRMEQERWQRIDQEKEEEAKKWAAKRESNHLGRSNNNSVPYNPITLTYAQSNEAERLRALDRAAEQRAALRSKMLYERANTYNPVTGEDIKEVVVPPRTMH